MQQPVSAVIPGETPHKVNSEFISIDVIQEDQEEEVGLKSTEKLPKGVPATIN